MTARAIDADWKAGALIALGSTLVAVLPPVPRAVAAGVLLLIPLLGWMLIQPARWIAVFLGAVLLLPPLPASFGDSGPHPALVVAATGFFAALLWAEPWGFSRTPVALPACALAGVMFASVGMALINSGGAIALGSAVRVLLFALAPWTFLCVACGPGRILVGSGANPIMLLFSAGALSAAFACVDFFLQLPAPAGYSPQFVWLPDHMVRRAQGLFYDAGALGNLCAFLLILIAACFLLRGRPLVSRWLLAAGALPVSLALVLSYSRAALLNALAGVAALLWLRWRDVKWTRLLLLPAVATLVVVGVHWLSPALAESWWSRVRHTIDFAFSATDTAFSGRVTSWQTLTAFALEHPLRVLFGVGYKTLAYSDVAGQPVIADNTYLSTLIETGVAGLAALCALHVSILRATFRAVKSADPVAVLCGGWAFAFWIGEMVQMMAADLLTYWRLLPVFFFVIGMAVVRAREQDK